MLRLEQILPLIDVKLDVSSYVYLNNLLLLLYYLFYILHSLIFIQTILTFTFIIIKISLFLNSFTTWLKFQSGDDVSNKFHVLKLELLRTT